MNKTNDDGRQRLLEDHPGFAAASSVRSFFGEPYQAASKTLVPLLSIRIEGDEGRAVSVKPVAIVRIEGTKVSVRALPNRLPIVLASLALGGWNAYWLLKTIRVWLRKR